jgi:hypothetical protein
MMFLCLQYLPAVTIPDIPRKLNILTSIKIAYEVALNLSRILCLNLPGSKAASPTVLSIWLHQPQQQQGAVRK